MPAEQPTVLATSIGSKPGTRTRPEFARLLHHAVELSGVSGGAPRVTHCTDDGVGLVYHGTQLVEAVAEVRGKGAYIVTADTGEGGAAVSELRLEPSFLG